MEGFCQIMENLSYKKNDESDEQEDEEIYFDCSESLFGNSENDDLNSISETNSKNSTYIMQYFRPVIEKALKVKKHIEKIQKLEQENESSNFLIHLKKIFLVTPQSVFISSPKYAIRLKANYLNLEILKCSKRRIAKLVNLSDKNVQQTPVIYLTHQAAEAIEIMRQESLKKALKKANTAGIILPCYSSLNNQQVNEKFSESNKLSNISQTNLNNNNKTDINNGNYNYEALNNYIRYIRQKCLPNHRDSFSSLSESTMDSNNEEFFVDYVKETSHTILKRSRSQSNTTNTSKNDKSYKSSKKDTEVTTLSNCCVTKQHPRKKIIGLKVSEDSHEDSLTASSFLYDHYPDLKLYVYNEDSTQKVDEDSDSSLGSYSLSSTFSHSNNNLKGKKIGILDLLPPSQPTENRNSCLHKPKNKFVKKILSDQNVSEESLNNKNSVDNLITMCRNLFQKIFNDDD